MVCEPQSVDRPPAGGLEGGPADCSGAGTPVPRAPFLGTVHRTAWGAGAAEALVESQEKVSFQLLLRASTSPSQMGALVPASINRAASVGVLASGEQGGPLAGAINTGFGVRPAWVMSGY